ncbi:hypothetical protein L1049_019764 [Liquidambar formosana]|uniref:Uncharacterized protein n=1 Tax=Liquidambar formosana TaxID=63359 RepID=A0AAP0SD17_LIQFO
MGKHQCNHSHQAEHKQRNSIINRAVKDHDRAVAEEVEEEPSDEDDEEDDHRHGVIYEAEEEYEEDYHGVVYPEVEEVSLEAGHGISIVAGARERGEVEEFAPWAAGGDDGLGRGPGACKEGEIGG